MNTFIHEGRTGPWVCTISLLKSDEGNFSGAGEVVFQGRLRCKLVLCRPGLTNEEGFEILKRKCIAWIEEAERTPRPDTTTSA